jgi:alpha-beta hydrolase superfamily lysophospholipase
MDGTPPYGYSYYPAGAGQEVFEESVLDIEAGIDFLVARGYSEIILVGHSTGANKVCYFAATQKNPHVAAVVLTGSISDRLHAITDYEKFEKDLAHMHELIRVGRGDELLVGYHFFPMTPKRFISLFEPRSNEDVFDYGEEEPKLKYFSQITLPLLVHLAGADEAADRPIANIQKAFDSHAKSLKYKSVIIPGALHRFNGHEQEAVAAMVDWIKTL